MRLFNYINRAVTVNCRCKRDEVEITLQENILQSINKQRNDTVMFRNQVYVDMYLPVLYKLHSEIFSILYQKVASLKL